MALIFFVRLHAHRPFMVSLVARSDRGHGSCHGDTEAQRSGAHAARHTTRRAPSDRRAGVTTIKVTICRTDISRLRPDQSSIAKLFQTMCGPAEDATDGERRREQFGRQSEAMQQERRVELDIGIDSTLWLAFAEQTKRGGLDLPREVVEALIAPARIEALGGPTKDIGTRVTDSVDAVSESHEALAPIQFRENEGVRALGSPDFKHHVQRRPGCA